jgi:hypothetical protein
MEDLVQSNKERDLAQHSYGLMFSTMMWDEEFDTEIVLTKWSSMSNTEKMGIIRDIDRNFFTHRRCLTDAGLVGQVPIYTSKGDLVVIFVGAAVPFIVRPVKEGYQLIGQAYLHALMGGEALDPSFGSSGDIKLV